VGGPRTDLPSIRLHDLRHGHATDLLAAGANVKVASERLGRATVGFTLDVDAHVMPGQPAEAAAAVAALVDARGSTGRTRRDNSGRMDDTGWVDGARRLPVTVHVDDRLEEWMVRIHERLGQRGHNQYTLALHRPDGLEWTSPECFDVFDCLAEVRKQVEPLGILVCCNGSRRVAWPSAMSRDMGGGFQVYLLDSNPGWPVHTFDPAPVADVVPWFEQVEWHAAYVAGRRS
jgi:hypothetical protein